MSCPLCNFQESRASWMGATVFRDARYAYRECLECRSVYVSPIPDRETLAQMYGEDYEHFISVEEPHSGAEGTRRVLKEMGRVTRGAFLDYGCGGGHLLREAAALGWSAYGVEFDRTATEFIKSSGDVTIVGELNRLPANVSFDAVHLGDVIEHLTDVNREMPAILDRLKPGGLLIAQGPLEANFNLFLLGLRTKKLIRNTDSSMPLYHVGLATRDGQEKFFLRFGLEPLVFEVFETAHPAPERIVFADLKNIRQMSLFLLRKISQAFSRVFNPSAGNRYFYVGARVE